MPYWLALLVVIMAWSAAFKKTGDFLLRRGLDWANMATTLDISHRRKAGMVVLVKHIIFTALMLFGIWRLAAYYPGQQAWTFAVGIVWSLFLFPVGLFAIPVIVILWIT